MYTRKSTSALRHRCEQDFGNKGEAESVTGNSDEEIPSMIRFTVVVCRRGQNEGGLTVAQE